MAAWERLIRPLMFRVDAERAHHLGIAAARRALFAPKAFADPLLRCSALGFQLQNPIGLAAGFDKNAVALDAWHRYGFGFVEIGTVTLKPQPGNAKPRIFRLTEDHALINRLGFNSDGALAVAERIRASNSKIPVGINIGKNKETPAEASADEYGRLADCFKGLGAYLVVNVSSPNTTGLRELQEPDSLVEIVKAAKAADPEKPVLVKLSPDLDDAAMESALGAAVDGGASGVIATNTTTSRGGLSPLSFEAGGLSGKPLRARSDEALARASRYLPKGMTLIGAGGIFTGDDVLAKIRLGAHLCQLYTGWVYGGPGSAVRILRELTEALHLAGATTFDEIRGTDL